MPKFTKNLISQRVLHLIHIDRYFVSSCFVPGNMLAAMIPSL